MVSGSLCSSWRTVFDVWVAMRRADRTSFIQKIEDRLRDALGSPSAIFAHSRQGGPVPRSYCGKYPETKELELPLRGQKSIEIGQLGVERVTYAFDRIERDAAHLGEARDGCGFHVDKGGIVRGGEAALFGFVGDFGAGGKPEFAGAGIATEALAGLDVDDASDVVRGAGSEIGC